MLDNAQTAFRRGFLDTVSFNLVIIPFALLFGVLAAEMGWSLPQIFGISLAVIAGASQFTALQLLGDDAPFLVIVVAALAVNLRMAMYSASLAPHLGAAPIWKRALVAYGLTDQAYGVSIKQFTREPMSVNARITYMAGSILALAPFWYLFSLLGALVGQAIPPEFALDFAVPITFIALFAPALRSLPHIVAALVSVVAALGLGFLPFNLWMVIAALLGMAAGALTETALERSQP